MWQTTELHFSLGAVCPGWSTDCRKCWSDFAVDRRLTTGTVQLILPGIVDKLQELSKWFCLGSSTNYRNCSCDFAWDRRQTTGTVQMIVSYKYDKLWLNNNELSEVASQRECKGKWPLNNCEYTWSSSEPNTPISCAHFVRYALVKKSTIMSSCGKVM